MGCCGLRSGWEGNLECLLFSAMQAGGLTQAVAPKPLPEGLGPQCVVDAIPETLAINTSLGHRLGYFVAPTLPYLHSEDQHMAYQRRAWILSFP